MPVTSSDFGPGTQIKPTIVHITFDDAGDVNHVGVGFEVFLPSAVNSTGQQIPVAADALTWTPPAAVATRLGQVMAALLSDLANHTGLSVNHALGRSSSQAPPAPIVPVGANGDAISASGTSSSTGTVSGS
jgi:hypothetical protein